MVELVTSPLTEIENIEDDDSHHDFGGGHGSKGHDFAHFWLIVRLLEKELGKCGDYMFICEYAQDIAEFDSSDNPGSVILYQLKKKEDGYWTAADLTGQTEKNFQPKSTKPISKLFKSVKAFRLVSSRGVFVSNAKYQVDLGSEGSSVNSDSIFLSQLELGRANGLKEGFGKIHGIDPAHVDLNSLELRKVDLSVDDLQSHTNGKMLEFLRVIAPDHMAQAASLVDTIYVRVKATARRTDKSGSWPDLIKARGFGRKDFQSAVEALSTIPDRPGARNRLFERLSNDWSSRKTSRVQIELTRCAREKILLGVSNRWQIPPEVISELCEYAEANDHSDLDCFKSVVSSLSTMLPELSGDEVYALAIYEMTEWNLNQVPV